MMIVPFERQQTEALVQLWQRCQLAVPWNDPHRDIDRKINHSPDKCLVGVMEGKLMASVMFNFDGHRGSVNYLAVDPRFRGRGYGRQLMTEVEACLHRLGCPKLNIMIRASNIEVKSFYEHLGYADDEVLVLGKRLIQDNSIC